MMMYNHPIMIINDYTSKYRFKEEILMELEKVWL